MLGQKIAWSILSTIEKFKVYKCFLMRLYPDVPLSPMRFSMFLTPSIQCVHLFMMINFHSEPVHEVPFRAFVNFAFFTQVSNSDRRLCLHLNISHLEIFHDSPLWECLVPMFHILSHLKFVWLSFESLKVGCLSISCWCTLHLILEGPIWRTIALNQLRKMRNFLLHCIAL